MRWNLRLTTTEPAAGGKPALSTSYLYDADGGLLIRRATGDGDTVLYLGGTEVRLTTKGTTKTITGTRYYSIAGQNVAVRTATTGTVGTKLSFLAANHHGTISLAIDATTQAVTKRYTTPFGAPRGTEPTSWPDDKAFLGKPADKATGLTHIGAREYDPRIGQFISVDPVLSLGQHQSLNGYSYAGNTPVTAFDPTGLIRIVTDDSGNVHSGSGKSQRKLTTGATPDGRRPVIYDEYGIPHIVGGSPDNPNSTFALSFMNDDLKAAGVWTDPDNPGTGEAWLSQDDRNPMMDKGVFEDKEGNTRFVGTASDYIKVTYVDGKIVDVIDADAVGAGSPDKSLGHIKGDIDGKMTEKDPVTQKGKTQTNNVVFVAASEEQVEMVAEAYAGDPRVRAIHGLSGFDSRRVFSAATGVSPHRVSPRMRGRVMGVAGLLMPFAQTRSYVDTYGSIGGFVEMGIDFLDPFGLHDLVMPSSGTGCYENPTSCA